MKCMRFTVAGLFVALMFVAGCQSAPPPASKATVWGTAPGASADWALKCDACGTVYAQNMYSKPVSLAEHRKWAETKGCASVVKGERTYDVCGKACQKKLLADTP